MTVQGGKAAMPAAAAAVDQHTVLIAEDNEPVRDTVAEILGARGHRVHGVADGLQALQVLRGGAIDVLVLDLHMPGLDGVTLLQQLEVPPPVVVVHSAFEFYSPKAVAQQLGAKVFRALRKPVAPAELIAAVEDALGELEALRDGSTS